MKILVTTIALTPTSIAVRAIVELKRIRKINKEVKFKPKQQGNY